MHIAIDLKNLALHSGGIAAFGRPLVAAWLAHRPEYRFSLVGPRFDTAAFAGLGNWKRTDVPWPAKLPRSLRHPVYDTLLFPRAIAKLRPKFVFSLYHDVLLPAPSTGITSSMMIHDTCLDDVAEVYPRKIRRYYLTMLRVNLRRARHVLTVSQASRERIIERYRVPATRISVVYNPIEQGFAAGLDLDNRARAVRSGYGGSRVLFYAGGSEHRKNVGRLVAALGQLLRAGRDICLVTTGVRDPGWARVLDGGDALAASRVNFLGRLTVPELETYYMAADAVVYPTLCEGFGRVCLEAMMAGTPLACSDLPVLREVAADYPHYFNPYNISSIAEGIERALASGRLAPRRMPQFEQTRVATRFVTLMDRLTDDIVTTA
jgi:glycosyltransferase involved in cell wall biosynthesis